MTLFDDCGQGVFLYFDNYTVIFLSICEYNIFPIDY